MSGTDDHGSYIREKLRGAATTIHDEDGRSMQDRLWSAYRDNLSSLQVKWFPHADAQQEFQAIEAMFIQFGEAAPTTVGLMSDADAAALAERILALADRYLA